MQAQPEQLSSSSRSASTQTVQTVSKRSLEHVFEISEAPRTESTRPSRLSGLDKSFASTFPKVHHLCRRCWIYWRGPRPRIDLPDPQPWLDIDFHFKGRHFVLPIESSFLRWTRQLTAAWIFPLFAVAYIISLAFFARAQAYQTPASAFIGCTSTYWFGDNGCGLDGLACAPFNDTTFDFRCPAQCSSTILQNPRTIGNQEMAFAPLIVGGGDDSRTFRGDSFICAAGVQAGLISDSRGGCASLQLIGNHTNFLPFTNNGLSSIGFSSVFPLSFRLLPTTSLRHCKDMRNEALVFDIFITCIIFLLLRPKPIVTYWSMVCIGFWHVALFSEPRGFPPALSYAFGSFLPALFIAYGFWRLAFRFVLPSFTRIPLEGMVWYLGPFWAGVLTNLTMEKIPISRLTASDIQKRPGAVTALIIIILILAAAVINQVRVIRKTGWLPHYLKWYITGGLITLVLALLPGLQLRLHHYLLSMVLIPGTAFPTRLSAIYQGFLLGMFLNGVAAYGMDSILQTADELRQDAPLGSDLPDFLTNSTSFNSSIPFVNQSIFWDVIPEGWTGFSLLVDDVERYSGDALNFSLAAFEATIPHFFRLAFTSGAQTGDYTKAATLYPNGTWVDPAPGPS